MNFVHAITRTAHKCLFKMKTHAPGIMIVTGAVGIVYGTYLACKATTKCEDVLDEHRAEMENVDANDQEQKVRVYANTAKNLARIYGPAIAVEGASIGLMFGAYGIMKGRYSMAMAAYSALNARFNEYRDKVRNQNIIDADSKRELDAILTDPEYGEVAEENSDGEKRFSVLYNTGLYKFVFDYTNPNYSKTYIYNDTFLKRKEREWNYKLQARGFVFLNEVLIDLGFDPIPEGQFAGWCLQPGNYKVDNRIDFGISKGIFDRNTFTLRPPCNEEEEATISFDDDCPYLLDFNVDGDIHQVGFAKYAADNKKW